MRKDDYKNEIRRIEASDAFKAATKKKLKKWLEEPTPTKGEKPKIGWFTSRRMVATVAALAVLVGGGTVLQKTLTDLSGRLQNLQEKGAIIEPLIGGAGFGASALAERASTIPPQPSSYFVPQPQAGLTQPPADMPPAHTAPVSQPVTAEATPFATATALPVLPIEWPKQPPPREGFLYADGRNELPLDWANSPDTHPPTTLPVYLNTLRQTATGYLPSGLSQQQLEALIEEQAGILGLSIVGYTVEKIAMLPSGEQQGLYSVTGTAADGTTFTALRNSQLAITFAEPLLPKAGTPPPEEELSVQLEYLMALEGEYEALLGGMENPRPRVTLCYTDLGEKQWEYTVYDAGLDEETLYINRSLAGMSFVLNEAGRLAGLGLSRSDNSHPVASYPLRPPEQAAKELLAGQGLSLLGTACSVLTEQDIAGIDLVYLSNPIAEYTMPFYEFYLEQIPPRGANLPAGMKYYTCWMIPALQQEYLQAK